MEISFNTTSEQLRKTAIISPVLAIAGMIFVPVSILGKKFIGVSFFEALVAYISEVILYGFAGIISFGALGWLLSSYERRRIDRGVIFTESSIVFRWRNRKENFSLSGINSFAIKFMYGMTGSGDALFDLLEVVVDTFSEMDENTPSRVQVEMKVDGRKTSMEMYGITYRNMIPQIAKIKNMYSQWSVEEKQVHKDRTWIFSKENS